MKTQIAEIASKILAITSLMLLKFTHNFPIKYNRILFESNRVDAVIIFASIILLGLALSSSHFVRNDSCLSRVATNCESNLTRVESLTLVNKVTTFQLWIRISKGRYSEHFVQHSGSAFLHIMMFQRYGYGLRRTTYLLIRQELRSLPVGSLVPSMTPLASGMPGSVSLNNIVGAVWNVWTFAFETKTCFKFFFYNKNGENKTEREERISIGQSRVVSKNFSPAQKWCQPHSFMVFILGDTIKYDKFSDASCIFVIRKRWLYWTVTCAWRRAVNCGMCITLVVRVHR